MKNPAATESPKQQPREHKKTPRFFTFSDEDISKSSRGELRRSLSIEQCEELREKRRREKEENERQWDYEIQTSSYKRIS